MATVVVDTEIPGRLGRYRLRIWDQSDAASEVRPITVREPVTVSYGEQSRDFPESVLKSYCRVIVDKGADDIRSIFRGSFDPKTYPAQITGPGIDWRGYVEPEGRYASYRSRVAPGSTEILLTDGFYTQDSEKEFITSIDFGPFGSDVFWAPGIILDTFFLNKESSDGTGLTLDEARVLFDGTFIEFNFIDRLGAENSTIGPRYVSALSSDVRQATTFAEVSFTDIVYVENVYERLKEFALFQRARVYRRLSEAQVMFQPIRYTGWDADYIDQFNIDQAETFSPVRIKNDDVFGELQECFLDLEAAGVVEVDLSDFEPAGGGSLEYFSPDLTTEPVPGGAEYTLMRGAQVTSRGPSTSIKDEVSDAFSGILGVELGTAAASDEIAEFYLGNIDPNQPIGLVLDWDVYDNGSNPTLSVEIDYNGSTVATQADGRSSFSLQATSDTTPKDIEVRFIGRDVFVYPVARYYRTGRIVETLVVGSTQAGLENVEIPFGQMPLLDNENGPVTTASRYEPGTDETDTGDGSDFAGTSFAQPWLSRANMEAAYRPFGVQTFQGNLSSVYGPEDAFIIEKPDGDLGYFVVGTGMDINLTRGTTNVSLIEVPQPILPTELQTLLL